MTPVQQGTGEVGERFGVVSDAEAGSSYSPPPEMGGWTWLAPPRLRNLCKRPTPSTNFNPSLSTSPHPPYTFPRASSQPRGPCPPVGVPLLASPQTAHRRTPLYPLQPPPFPPPGRGRQRTSWSAPLSAATYDWAAAPPPPPHPFLRPPSPRQAPGGAGPLGAAEDNGGGDGHPPGQRGEEEPPEHGPGLAE